SQHGQAKRFCDSQCGLISPLLRSFAVPLHFNVDVTSPENANELFDCLTASNLASGNERRSQRPFIASGQTNETFAVLLCVSQLCRPFLLGTLTHLEARYELAEILVSLS